MQIHQVGPKLARLFQIDPRPIDAERPSELRLVGNCRDYALLISAFLKELGVPARARCGCAARAKQTRKILASSSGMAGISSAVT